MSLSSGSSEEEVRRDSICSGLQTSQQHHQTKIFPLPRLDDMLDTIGETSVQYFSVLEMASGFWQIPLTRNNVQVCRYYPLWTLPVQETSFWIIKCPNECSYGNDTSAARN